MSTAEIKARIAALRRLMTDAGIDAYIIPSDDDHASEYVNGHFKCREWISGFTGSAGTVLITAGEKAGAAGGTNIGTGGADEPDSDGGAAGCTNSSTGGAWLWTDGRYFLQAESQLAGSGIGLMKMGEPGVPSIEAKICELAANIAEEPCTEGSSPADTHLTLGFCGDTMTATEGGSLERKCPVDIVWDRDLVGEIWEDRPPVNPSGIWELPPASCGMSYEDKLAKVRSAMAAKGADVLLVSDLMETAWLFNLRGSDIQNTPVFYSYAIVTADGCCLFTLPGALGDDVSGMLKSKGVALMDQSAVPAELKRLSSGKTLWADKSKTSYALIRSAAPGAKDIYDAPTPIEIMKAVKNETEIRATEHAHLKDGIAVTKFIYWLKQNNEKITELDASRRLELLRRSQEGCFDLSFPSIVGYMRNGAIIHYEPTEGSDTVIGREGFLLVDSGGQYIDGTTDITRTIAMGPLTDKMRKYYTLVLKGHIDLAMAEFPRGTTGKELDATARKPLLDNGLDYNHGTGHGVGHILSVHEGPNYISKRNGGGELMPGMITSDEPGVYIEGEFGIRIESEILCAETGKKADGADILGFRVITLAPLERDAVVREMLTEKELSWLDSYHEHVYSSLKSYLTAEEADWLRKETLPL